MANNLLLRIFLLKPFDEGLDQKANSDFYIDVTLTSLVFVLYLFVSIFAISTLLGELNTALYVAIFALLTNCLLASIEWKQGQKRKAGNQLFASVFLLVIFVSYFKYI